MKNSKTFIIKSNGGYVVFHYEFPQVFCMFEIFHKKTLGGKAKDEKELWKEVSDFKIYQKIADPLKDCKTLIWVWKSQLKRLTHDGLAWK